MPPHKYHKPFWTRVGEKLMSLAPWNKEDDKAASYSARRGSILATAIKERWLLEIRYDGEIGYIYIEPHAYGKLADGSKAIFGYRVRYRLEQNQPEGWVVLSATHVISICLTGTRFDGNRTWPENACPLVEVIAEA